MEDAMTGKLVGKLEGSAKLEQKVVASSAPEAHAVTLDGLTCDAGRSL